MLQPSSECKPSKFKLCFKLKQHTPIIHFQSDQVGATLRATELKPKLDKFLIKYFKKEHIAYKSFLISEEKEVFDYKVKIIDDISKENKNIDSTPIFFANMGKKRDKKIYQKYSTNNQPKIIFSSFQPDIIEYIKEYFPQFLATTNFGTRQSKGYGSFYLHENSDNHKSIEKALSDDTFYLEAKIYNQSEIEEVINYFWTRLKSGINLNYNKGCDKPYSPAFSKEYFYENNITWDKRWIKETFFGLKEKSQNPKFIRALLGLTSNYSYKQTTQPCSKKRQLKIEDDYQIDIFNNSVKRIKSPITFKPFIENNETKVYIILDEITVPEDREFKFIKRFKYKYDDFQQNNRTKYKTKLLPEYDPNKKSKPIKSSKEQDIKKIIDKTNKNNDVNFDYKKQNIRFKNFLDEFCELKDGLWCPKIFTLDMPSKFELKEFFNQYISSLQPRYKTEYLERGKVKIIDVDIKKIGASS